MGGKGRLYASAAIIPLVLIGAQAAAQTVTLADPPVRLPLDANGVDLSTGAFHAPSSSIRVGDDQSGLMHVRARVANGWRHNYMLTVKETSSKATVAIGGTSWAFTPSGGAWISDLGSGETLTEDSAGYTFTARDGTVYHFDKTTVQSGPSYYGTASAVGTTITEASGRVTTLSYRSDSYRKPVGVRGTLVTMRVLRLQSVNTSTGYQLKFRYAVNDFPDPDFFPRKISMHGITLPALTRLTMLLSIVARRPTTAT